MVFCKKYKDSYVITDVNYSCEKFNIFTEAKKHRKNKSLLSSSGEDKMNNNLIRARQCIFDYAYNNDFNYFITLTISSKYDRTDYLSYIREFSQNIRDLRKKYGKIEYLLIPEYHKDNVNIHFHGLLYAENIQDELYLNDNGFYSWRTLDYLGFNSISPIRDNFNVSCYITKYITKNHMNVAKKYHHSYFRSKGLEKPESFKLKNVDIQDWDYQNIYCKKKKVPLDFFKDYNFITE